MVKTGPDLNGTCVYSNISFSQDAAFLDAAVREREEELSRRTLQALLDMRIKFPGKTDEEAEVILDSVSVGHFAGYFSNVFLEFRKIAGEVYFGRGRKSCGILVHSCFPCFFQIQDNWKFHKPRVASYWLVKLDSIKRRKARKTVSLLYYCFLSIF